MKECFHTCDSVDLSLTETESIWLRKSFASSEYSQFSYKTTNPLFIRLSIGFPSKGSRLFSNMYVIIPMLQLGQHFRSLELIDSGHILIGLSRYDFRWSIFQNCEDSPKSIIQTSNELTSKMKFSIFKFLLNSPCEMTSRLSSVSKSCSSSFSCKLRAMLKICWAMVETCSSASLMEPW